ncbi:unnamed protein product [Nippostrongylus brasiliensis]|uniref:N-acetyl-D-glucosamine kinase n=1 Tax=Nippostrongylus brasiliensis TaxID=27835 RepID=A0A0N4XDV7_NIPBR|nr:unnamed protein product [Nippostrongylus brasiliensis]
MADIGANQQHWRGLWPAAQSEFLCGNPCMLAKKSCLELGSGTGLVGIAVGKLGAGRVVLTDYPSDEVGQIPPLLTQGSIKVAFTPFSGLSSSVFLSPALMQNPKFLGDLDSLDFLVASDVFYDVCTFQPLIITVSKFFDKFPNLRFYFSYKFTVSRGATESKLIFVNADGETLGESTTGGTNYNLDGIERTANNVATWVRKAAQENNIRLPLKGLGLGLSGAEGARDNALFVECLRKHHGDLFEHVFINSDAVATVASAFENGGVILIAGTGSSCRVLLENGRVFGVGGWGHIIGDGGSGFWIALRAIRMLFDEDDGMETPHDSTDLIRELMLKHFKIEDKVDILEHLYSKFQKSHIASFTKELAKHTDDPAINRLFFDAGEILGRQFVVAEARAEINLVLVGSVFLSWKANVSGFVHAVDGSWIPKVHIYTPSDSSAIGAAILVAKQADVTIPRSNGAKHMETISFYE